MPSRAPLARSASLVMALGTTALAAGWVLRHPAALALWPWSDGRLTLIFAGSVAAAIAASFVWVAVTEEWGVMAAGGLNMAVTAGGIAGYLALVARRPPAALPEGSGPLGAFAAVLGAMAVISVGLYWIGRRIPTRDGRPCPRPVRWSFVVFGALLLAVGAALVRQLPDVMPWPVSPETSVLIGWVFLGDALFYLYALVRPLWHHAAPQLWSFLLYDLVLLPPLAAHWADVRPAHRASLVIYLAVLVYSAGLSAYYLLLHPATRVGARRAA